MGDDGTENTLRGRDLAGLGGVLVGAAVGGMVIGLVVDERRSHAGRRPRRNPVGVAAGAVGFWSASVPHCLTEALP